MNSCAIKKFVRWWKAFNGERYEDEDDFEKIPVLDEEIEGFLEKLSELPRFFRKTNVTLEGDKILLVHRQNAATGISDIKEFFDCFQLSGKLEDMASFILDAPNFCPPESEASRRYDASGSIVYDNPMDRSVEENWEACIPEVVTLNGYNIKTEIRAFSILPLKDAMCITCISRSYPSGMLGNLSSYSYDYHTYISGYENFYVWEEINVNDSEPLGYPKKDCTEPRYIPVMKVQKYLDTVRKFKDSQRVVKPPNSTINEKLTEIGRSDFFPTLYCLNDRVFSGKCMNSFSVDLADLGKCWNGWFSKDKDIMNYARGPLYVDRPGEPFIFNAKERLIQFFDLVRTIIRRDYQVGEFVPVSTVFVGNAILEKGYRTLDAGGMFNVDIVRYSISSNEGIIKGEQASNIYRADHLINSGGVAISNVNIPLLTQPVFEKTCLTFHVQYPFNRRDTSIVYQGEWDGRPLVKDIFVP